MRAGRETGRGASRGAGRRAGRGASRHWYRHVGEPAQPGLPSVESSVESKELKL